MPDLPHHEDLVGAELAQGHGQVEVVVDAADGGLDQGLQLVVPDAADVDAADLGDGEDAAAVHDRVVVDVDLAPGADQDLVTRPEHVVGGDGDVLAGGEHGRGLEHVLAEDRQEVPGRVLD